MNTFMHNLENATNYGYTENGAIKYNSTNSTVYDMFAFMGAYRKRRDEDCILLFKNAFEEDPLLALKCLFYGRDCRGGLGERRFFRVCLRWLAEYNPKVVRRNLEHIPFFGRWDDLYILMDTSVEKDVFELIKNQLILDMQDCMKDKNTGISLLGKWLKSENASSAETKKLAKKTREALGMTARDYRKMLSRLRERIKVLEKLMSANRWEEIDFSKIPSKAGLIYRNAFARRDIIAERYAAFARDKETKVNAATLYPYEVVKKALELRYSYNLSNTDRLMVNKYWENLPDYLEGKDCKMMCVVDTSGSMVGTPMNVAISLGMYCAERLSGPFSNRYISFSRRPQLIKVEGIDFVDKVSRIYRTNLCENTNLNAVFDLLLNVALDKNTLKEDIPETIVVISDMEIDTSTGYNYWSANRDDVWTTKNTATEMEKIKQKWASYGFKLPRLIYWNVDARHNTILDSGPNVTFVSGASPVIFKSVLTGKNGYDLMLEAITADRYNVIK